MDTETNQKIGRVNRPSREGNSPKETFDQNNLLESLFSDSFYLIFLFSKLKFYDTI